MKQHKVYVGVLQPFDEWLDQVSDYSLDQVNRLIERLSIDAERELISMTIEAKLRLS